MCISHLLSINFWFIIPLQTTGLLIIKPPARHSCQCVSFLWKRDKKPQTPKNGDLEMSHLYFKGFFAVNMLPQQPRFLLSGRRQISLVPSWCKAERRKGDKQWKFTISLFEYVNYPELQPSHGSYPQCPSTLIQTLHCCNTSFPLIK